MIVYVQKEKKRIINRTRKPFRGNFYSQYTYDTISGKTEPIMTEDELRRHIFFGNIEPVCANKIQETIDRMNAERGEHERPNEYFVSCDQAEHQIDEEDIHDR